MFGCAFRTAKCRGVQPSFVFVSGSLPLSRSSFTAILLPWYAAKWSAVWPLRFFSFTFAPRLTRRWIAVSSLLIEAKINDVIPLSLRAFTSAPRRTKTRTASICPDEHAIKSGVCWPVELASTSKSASFTSRLMASASPKAAATWRGVNDLIDICSSFEHFWSLLIFTCFNSLITSCMESRIPMFLVDWGLVVNTLSSFIR